MFSQFLVWPVSASLELRDSTAKAIWICALHNLTVEYLSRRIETFATSFPLSETPIIVLFIVWGTSLHYLENTPGEAIALSSEQDLTVDFTSSIWFPFLLGYMSQRTTVKYPSYERPSGLALRCGNT